MQPESKTKLLESKTKLLYLWVSHLYSTVTRKHSRWAAALGNTPNVLGIITCWYLKTLQFALPPTRTLKFALPPTQTPNAKRWIVGCVWSPTQNSHVCHVVCAHFIQVGYPTRTQFAVEYGLYILQTLPIFSSEYEKPYFAGHVRRFSPNVRRLV